MLAQLEASGCLLRRDKAVIEQTVSDSSPPRPLGAVSGLQSPSGDNGAILVPGNISVSLQHLSHLKDPSSDL